MLSIARRIQRSQPCLLLTTRHFQAARTDSGSRPPARRRSKHSANLKLKKIDDKSDWWVVDGEMHEIGKNVPPRERFVIPRDNIPNRRRKQLRDQFMRRTRLVLKESEHEPWCKRYMELYNEMRENWERLYWDEGYSKKLAQDHANYDSAEDDDEDFNPYKQRQQRAGPMREGGFGRNRQDGGFGRNRQEGDFGRNRQEGDFGRNRQEGDFGRNSQEGGFGRNRQEGGFGRRDNTWEKEGGFGRNRQEGGFGRNMQEGGFGRNMQEGGFGRNMQEGGFGRNRQGDNTWEKDGGIGRNVQGDNERGKVSLIKDKFEYDRERRMREKAFAPMTGQNDLAMDNSVSQNQPFDTRRYISDDSDSDSY